MEFSQARTLKWVATSSSRGSFLPKDQTQVSTTADRLFTTSVTCEAPCKCLRVLTHRHTFTHRGMFARTCVPRSIHMHSWTDLPMKQGHTHRRVKNTLTASLCKPQFFRYTKNCMRTPHFTGHTPSLKERGAFRNGERRTERESS